MKFLQQTYLLVFFLLLISACDPIELVTEDEDPVFTLSFSINGEDIDLAAGLDGYYMLTEGNNPLLFSNPYQGTLVKRDADGNTIEGEPTFILKFQQSETVRNSTDPNHFESFITGLVPISTNDDSALPFKEVLFTGDYQGTGDGPIYTWDFGDTQSSDFQDPAHAFPNLSEYSTSLNIVDDNECMASVTNTVSFDNRASCYANITINSINSTEAILESSSTGVSPFQYAWSDGSTNEDNVVQILSTTTSQNHCVTITDAEGCQSLSCIGIVKNEAGDINTCRAEMEVINYTKARTAPQFNSVSIDWSPTTGVEFFSREGRQPANSYFEVISFEEFELNEMGQRTVKIDFDMSCTVWETNKTNPQVLKGSGTIAVAIPD